MQGRADVDVVTAISMRCSICSLFPCRGRAGTSTGARRVAGEILPRGSLSGVRTSMLFLDVAAVIHVEAPRGELR
jgi:hypothetical protein